MLQNRESGGSWVPHAAHAPPMRAPQLEQKLASGGFSVSQAGQRIVRTSGDDWSLCPRAPAGQADRALTPVAGDT